jgi:hypothetical protein
VVVAPSGAKFHGAPLSYSHSMTKEDNVMNRRIAVAHSILQKLAA